MEHIFVSTYSEYFPSSRLNMIGKRWVICIYISIYLVIFALLLPQLATCEVEPEPPQLQDKNALLEYDLSHMNKSLGLACTTVEVGEAVTSKNGLIDPRYRWHNFRVYVDPVYSEADHARISHAMRILMDAIPNCVQYSIYPYGSPQPASGDYIHVRNANGCWSWIGKLGNRQEMSLQLPYCMGVGTIIHEMVHALGFHHEQNRPDRDDHVTILWENIRPEQQHNFDKRDDTSTFDVPYNLRSIMHYRNDDFTKNGQPTIVAKNGQEMGQTEDLQQTDIDKLKRMYSC